VSIALDNAVVLDRLQRDITAYEKKVFYFHLGFTYLHFGSFLMIIRSPWRNRYFGQDRLCGKKYREEL